MILQGNKLTLKDPKTEAKYVHWLDVKYPRIVIRTNQNQRWTVGDHKSISNMLQSYRNSAIPDGGKAPSPSTSSTFRSTPTPNGDLRPQEGMRQRIHLFVCTPRCRHRESRSERTITIRPRKGQRRQTPILLLHHQASDCSTTTKAKQKCPRWADKSTPKANPAFSDKCGKPHPVNEKEPVPSRADPQDLPPQDRKAEMNRRLW